jgi:hypothetical protein
VLTMAGAEIDWGRGLAALSTPLLRQYLDKRPIAMIPDQQAHRNHRLPTAAVQFQPTVRPVREALLTAEWRRVHAAGYSENEQGTRG